MAVACGGGDTAADDSGGVRDAESGSISVVATTQVWAALTASVGCDGSVVVETLIPPGADPHAFEPSLADRAALEDADLIIANGLDLEEGATDTLDAVEDGGTPVARMAESMDLRPYATGDDHGHDAEFDPHVWLDPIRVLGVLPELANALVAAGAEESVVETCLSEALARVDTVDDLIERMVELVPAERRKLVTNHDSLGYFAERYGFEVIATVLPTPSGLAETNPGHLERVRELVEREGVVAVFAEGRLGSADAGALAAEGVELVAIETVSPPSDFPLERRYFMLMFDLAGAIVGALDIDDALDDFDFD
ncbi:MAG: metal ABC transporter substrate-binding protein [Actinomycetota bacterium]|nr:metal ABC transporter substrate-binding protein [Actinomycetota bacterium]